MPVNITAPETAHFSHTGVRRKSRSRKGTSHGIVQTPNLPRCAISATSNKETPMPATIFALLSNLPATGNHATVIGKTNSRRQRAVLAELPVKCFRECSVIGSMKGSGTAFGWRSNQWMQDRMLPMLNSHKIAAVGTIPRHLRSIHAVDGTITKAPSQDVRRTEPATMFITVARMIHLRALRASSAAAAP
jgi:hypothetical protein